MTAEDLLIRMVNETNFPEVADIMAQLYQIKDTTQVASTMQMVSS